MSRPKIFYFPLRGRAEPVKLAYACKGIEFDVMDVDYQQMKTDLDAYPFGQCPRLVDGDVDVSQSNAILRHIARKCDLYGNNIKDAAMIDMVLDGVEAIKQKYLSLIYVDELKTRDTYASTHIDPSTAVGQRNGGAHFAYLDKLLQRNGGEFFSGSSLSIADITFWELLDTHMRVFEQEIKQHYPVLAKFHAAMANIPSIKAYLESPLRLDKVNNNNLG